MDDGVLDRLLELDELDSEDHDDSVDDSDGDDSDSDDVSSDRDDDGDDDSDVDELEDDEDSCDGTSSFENTKKESDPPHFSLLYPWQSELQLDSSTSSLESGVTDPQ